MLTQGQSIFYMHQAPMVPLNCTKFEKNHPQHPSGIIPDGQMFPIPKHTWMDIAYLKKSSPVGLLGDD